MFPVRSKLDFIEFFLPSFSAVRLWPAIERAVVRGSLSHGLKVLCLVGLSVLAGCSGEQGAATVPEEQLSDTVVGEPAPEKIVVYSSRKEHLIKPLFDHYEAKTGVKIEHITDSAGALFTRLEAEGDRTPADLLLTVDAGNLWHAAEAGLLKAVNSEVLNNRVPEHLRDAQGRWYGLSLRARTIVYSTERVSPVSLSSYSALAEPAFDGKLCLRTSKKVYNQSLVASLIYRLGEEKAQAVVEGWVSNLAVDVFSSDTRLIEAIAAGACDVGIVNTYYLGRLQQEKPGYPVALFWANQNDSGVHVNISGAGITTYSKHPAAAQAFLEWLASPEAQGDFAQLNLEFPVADGVSLDPVVSAWGEFKQDMMPVQKLGELQPQAVKLMDRAGYR